MLKKPVYPTSILKFPIDKSGKVERLGGVVVVGTTKIPIPNINQIGRRKRRGGSSGLELKYYTDHKLLVGACKAVQDRAGRWAPGMRTEPGTSAIQKRAWNLSGCEGGWLAEQQNKNFTGKNLNLATAALVKQLQGAADTIVGLQQKHIS